MSKVNLEKKNNLHGTLTVTVERGDYEPEFVEMLKKERRTAKLKGFRPGKAPMATIRKMMGDRLLLQLVNQRVSQDLYGYIEENDLKIVGSPIISEEQDQQEITAKTLQDYTFKFDLGFRPEFELQGMEGPAQPFTRYIVELDDEKVNEQIEQMRKRQGKSVEVDTIQEGDILTIQGYELEGEGRKENGVSNEFSLFVNNLQEPWRGQFLSAAIGDTVRANIFELEENTKPETVKKYLLGLEDAGTEVNDEFELEIKASRRMEPADLNQEFFDQVFGEGQVSSEDEMKEKIRQDVRENFARQGKVVLFMDMQNHLIESNPIELPDEFLKRWLSQENDDFSVEDYDDSAKGFRWTLIRDRILEDNGVEVKAEDVQAKAREKVMEYFGNQPWFSEEMIGGVLQRMLQDENERYRLFAEVQDDRIFEILVEKLPVEDKNVTVDEMNEVIQQHNEKYGRAEEEE